MPDLCSFSYAVVRIVPRVEREEFVNAGVILYCRALRYLAARVWLDRTRLRVLAPDLDLDEVQAQLDTIPCICAGGPAAGELGALDQAERFRWLTSPRSTVIQVSPVHAGLCADPEAALDRLAAEVGESTRRDRPRRPASPSV